jgi:hypothetical protein
VLRPKFVARTGEELGDNDGNLRSFKPFDTLPLSLSCDQLTSLRRCGFDLANDSCDALSTLTMLSVLASARFFCSLPGNEVKGQLPATSLIIPHESSRIWCGQVSPGFSL